MSQAHLEGHVTDTRTAVVVLPKSETDEELTVCGVIPGVRRVRLISGQLQSEGGMGYKPLCQVHVPVHFPVVKELFAPKFSKTNPRPHYQVQVNFHAPE